jgi:hypothetical protein
MSNGRMTRKLDSRPSSHAVRVTAVEANRGTTAGKHINNTRPIDRKVLSKRVPATKDTHATVEVLLEYNNEHCVFYVVRAEML